MAMKLLFSERASPYLAKFIVRQHNDNNNDNDKFIQLLDEAGMVKQQVVLEGFRSFIYREYNLHWIESPLLALTRWHSFCGL